MIYTFVLSEWSLGNRKCWLQHLAILINSMKFNTSYTPVMIWKGSEQNHLLDIMKEHGVRILHSEDCYKWLCDKTTGESDGVRQAVSLKLEAPILIANHLDSHNNIIMGDVDVLLNGEIGTQNFPLAAGPRTWPNDKGLNSGFMCMNLPEFLKRKEKIPELLNDKIIASRTFEQDLYDAMYPDFCKFDFGEEHRTFWHRPHKMPKAVHFQGPKILQVNNLINEPHNSGMTAQLFNNHKEEVIWWTRLAEQYLNWPYPIYNQLKYLQG